MHSPIGRTRKPKKVEFKGVPLSAAIGLVVSVAPAWAQQPPTSTELPPVIVETPKAIPPAKKKAAAKKKPAPTATLPAVPDTSGASSEPKQTTSTGPYGVPNKEGVIGYVATRSTTATKTDTPLVDVPQSVTVITTQQIKDQAMKSMGDVLRYVPGVSPAQGEGNRDQVTIRGQNTTADFFTDGVRDDMQYFRDFYNIDRVEVLKGPNAMIFGRGGGGGVINRVTKKADFDDFSVGTVQGGSFDNKRATVDVNEAANPWAAFRINGMYENSGNFRDYFDLERYGINPTVTLKPADKTRVMLSYEYFHDNRTADRGIPSQNGRPAPTDISTFFGNPAISYANVDVSVGTATVEHVTDFGLKIRNHTLLGYYDKFYQNVYPNSAVSGAGTVNLDAYNNATDRLNLFNQTDFTYKLDAGFTRHTLLLGTEFGRQWTDNLRKNGHFVGAAPCPNPGNDRVCVVPFSNPTNFNQVNFTNDDGLANHHVVTDIAAVYVQDQMEVTRYFDVIGGVRFDRFDLDVQNFNPSGAATYEERGRTDYLTSPRAGIVFKPIEPMSLYASYSLSYLPSAGDQFASLDLTTESLAPEKFTNYEVGFKWDIFPALAFTAAVYQLDRENTRFNLPNNGGVAQTGSSRSEGLEVGLTGYLTDAWEVAAGYAHQKAEITSTSTLGAAGKEVPLVPHDTFTLWNKYMFTREWGAGVGIIRIADSFAGTDNAVVLPGYTRVDAALFWNINEHLQAQLNVENVFDTTYYATAHNNNNISPGSPQAAFVTLTSRY